MTTKGISRRSLLGKSAACAGLMLTKQSMSAGTGDGFEFETDVVVCGGGGGGLAAALFARWQGHDVLVLEKGASIGGTAAKSAFWYWIPNNPAMQKLGLRDEKEDFIRLIARLSASDSYNPDDRHFGLPEWQYAMTEAFYDSGAPAAELLDERGALPYLHLPDAPDYWAELPEDKVKKGRVLVPKGINDARSDGGRVAIRNLFAAARRDGVRIKVSHRVERLIQDGSGRAIGVEATTNSGNRIRVNARHAVVFASGGFTHNETMRRNYLAYPCLGGCAALTNEGDIIRATDKAGVQLLNMKNAWLAPIPLERAARKDGSMISTFAMAGDSMLIVNKYGQRVADEKQPYNELGKVFGAWDGRLSEHPNLVLISIWDQRAQNKCASPNFGALIVPPGADNSHVIAGATLEDLSRNIEARLSALATIVSTQLSAGFLDGLKATISRFNQMAIAGKDLDFGRGERAISLFLNGPATEPNQINPTMWPIAEHGPFYAALLASGTLDTKGGPKTDVDARILDENDSPIPGLYGVGNCVASASGAAYWGGGGTIGPILAFAYRAAKAIGPNPLQIPGKT